MALESTDLFVVQKQGGNKEIRKASLGQLSDYLQAEPGVVYKGQANFTIAGDEPGVRNTGDLYINNAPGSGTWDWSANSGSITDVEPGDRCLWNGTNWDVIQSGVGDAGVEKVTASVPLSVSGDAAEPNIESRQATTTLSGHVARLATEADVVAGSGTGSVNAVVTADLLKKSNEDILSATSGGLTSVQGIDPIEVATSGGGATVNSPEISIKDSAVGQKGAIATFDSANNISDPETEGDYDTWVGGLDDSAAMTLKGVASNFVFSDFSGLEEA